MARCLRNCEECKYKDTCNESLTEEAIAKRVAKMKRDYTKFNDGKGEQIKLGIKLKDCFDSNMNMIKKRS